MDFEEILREAEEQQILQKKRIYTSMLNQPALVGINSTDRVITQSQDSFSSFQINLPRPALEVDAIQLVNANIPQCNPNIPDTACVFWYYRLSGYSGTVPNPDNLFMVRLLPTTYNPEYINNPQLYGFNKTFADYPALASELALACNNDLGWFNSGAYEDAFDRNYVVPFLPGEISITYNSGLNKFQFTGTNATTRFAYKEYNSFNTYDLDDVVFVDAGGGSAFATYQSLQNGNTGNAVTNTTWWKRVYVDVVREWDATTPYPVGRYVAYLEDLYQCIQNSTGDDPFTSPAYWTQIVESGEINYRYLSAGFGDPNVAVLQAKGNQQWNKYNLYETGAVVEFGGSYWSATFQNQGQEPFTFGSSLVWNNTTQYRKGQVVAYGAGPRFYKAAQDSFNQVPTPYSATYWILQCWSPTATLPNVVGLYEVTSAVDMVEITPGGATLIPFPVGVGGQPYTKVPKRILNTILGFTWNGVMYTELLQNIPSIDFVSVISGANTELYNRLRPIPPYITSTAVSLGGIESTSTSTQTYTADGYCNLVYSNIINIYCSVVYGSTVDTTRNTNLIAIGTMNCGNLGISYFSPIITNPLRVRGDVYGLEFQFFDECGDPYVFTNNAVVTLGLKFDYKKMPDEKVM